MLATQRPPEQQGSLSSFSDILGSRLPPEQQEQGYRNIPSGHSSFTDIFGTQSPPEQLEQGSPLRYPNIHSGHRSFSNIFGTQSPPEPQEEGSPWNIPSGPSSLSDILCTQRRPANILESIFVRPSSTSSGKYDHDLERRNADSRLFRIGSEGWYEMCTETLGIESSSEKRTVMDDGDDEEPLRRLRSRPSSMRKVFGAVREKPPPLSTLDKSGRPRYEMIKVTWEDGRVEMKMVRSHRHSVVRVNGSDGVLRMEMVSDEPEDEQHQEEEREDIEAASEKEEEEQHQHQEEEEQQQHQHQHQEEEEEKHQHQPQEEEEEEQQQHQHQEEEEQEEEQQQHQEEEEEEEEGM
ncbi:DUF3049 domain-containing protein [Cephalotus follicularis]|uniref:DUF3049 domain-containing protein n=1 Tax=Cephalotus follicularis TaxID=3775 RepID=A0A1Q3CJL7_CEPFO|nr:DUF3049 domain-containing protein [Cephalotus follicularis]